MKEVNPANESVARASRLPVRAALSAVCAAVCALAATGAPVAFKDAAKIRSWDASDDRNPAEPRPERRSVTWERLNSIDPGLREIGRLAVRGAKERVGDTPHETRVLQGFPRFQPFE